VPSVGSALPANVANHWAFIVAEELRDSQRAIASGTGQAFLEIR